MGRHGRSNRFLDCWHHREAQLADGSVLHWLLIDDPRHGAPHVECGNVTTLDGSSRLLHPVELLRLLVEEDHADAVHVRVDTIGRTFSH